MNTLFLNLLRSSLVVGVLTLILILVSPLWNRRYVAIWKKRLWCFLAAMLLLGTFIQLPAGTAKVEFSVPDRHVQIIQNENSSTKVHLIPKEPSPLNTLQRVPRQDLKTAQDSVSTQTTVKHSVDALAIVELVWAISTATYLFWLVLGEFLFHRKVHRWAKPVKREELSAVYQVVCSEIGHQQFPQLLICPNISSPMLTGLFRPKLLLPTEDYSETAVTYILRHELAHWQNHDLWWKLLFLTANAVHWFNPGVWLLRREANQDMERACDERVMQTANVAERRIYSEVLLSTVQNGYKPSLSTDFYGGARIMKERLRNILYDGKRRGIALAIAFAVLSVCAISLVACTQQSTKAEVEPSKASGERKTNDFYSILLLGQNSSNDNCDTIMLLSYNVTNQKLTVMSIPRDTIVNVPWDVKKINSVYNYYGGGNEGINALKTTVAQLVGFEPDYTVTIECEAVGKLVDAMGGVDFDVPRDMNYVDPSQDLVINIQKGKQKLNGNQAIQVVRFRDGPNGYADGDLGRIETQQAFFKSVIQQLLQVKNVTKIQDVAKIFEENVTTDLSAQNILWLGRSAILGGLRMENVNFITMPCETAACWSKTYRCNLLYVVPNTEKLIDLINNSLSPFTRKVELTDLDIPSVNSDSTISSTTGHVEENVAATEPSKATTGQ